MTEAVRRRVWSTVRTEPDGTGYRIMLDQRPLRLPGGAVLHLPSPALASAVADEWSRAGGGVVGGMFGPECVTLTRLAGTLQERVATNRPQAVALLLDYAGGDLLCYRAAHPAALAERQQAEWQPWLDWVARQHGAMLIVTQGVMPVVQPAAAVAGLRQALQAQDDVGLTGLGVLVPALGSLVLGLAVVEGALPSGDATSLALLDERHQLQHWGADADAVARQDLLSQEVADAALFVRLGREVGP